MGGSPRKRVPKPPVESLPWDWDPERKKGRRLGGERQGYPTKGLGFFGGRVNNGGWEGVQRDE